MFGMMSALEIIEQIKILPPEEKAKVVDYVHKMESTQSEPNPQSKLAATADKIFDRYDDLFRKLAQ